MEVGLSTKIIKICTQWKFPTRQWAVTAQLG